MTVKITVKTKKAKEPKVPVGTNIYVILDRSGSMMPLTNDTIGGFNSWLEEQKKAGDNQRLTLALFANDVRTLYSETPIEQIKPLDRLSYQATGASTSLLDAVGKTIGSVHDNKTDKILFLIMTDGQENSSREFKKEAVQALIEARKIEGWTFVYIGSDPAGFDDAKSMGYTQTFVVQSMDRGVYGAVGQSTMSYSGIGLRGQHLNMTQADLDARNDPKKETK